MERAMKVAPYTAPGIRTARPREDLERRRGGFLIKEGDGCSCSSPPVGRSQRIDHLIGQRPIRTAPHVP